MSEKITRKRLSILKILKESACPLSGAKITERLIAIGQDVSERTTRHYFLIMDREGLTRNMGKRGRVITEKGLHELHAARVIEKVGYLAARIDQMTYLMNFELQKKTGTVVVNVSVIKKTDIKKAGGLMKKVFACGYAMGKLLTVFSPATRHGDIFIPEDSVGVGTVCSVTLNGVLLSHGIPTHSRFGGLLELRDGKPIRFTELIHYEGTTLDPLEVFIGNRMTDYTGATRDGNGQIGVSFREMPAESRDKVVEIAKKLQDVGLGGFMTIGWPGQPLLDIPVSDGRIGVVVIGGLNPVAILVEQGIQIQSRAMATLVDFHTLFSFNEIDTRLRQI